MGTQAMITVIRNNKSMLSKRKDKKLGFITANTEKTEYNLPETTPKKLSEIRRNIIQENKIRSIKRLTVLGVTVVILLSIFIYFL
ncbi:hypothetical protein [uncultured Lacinutrix sp.]|uniref:hypothetical protein n=1 Tax=uncultured Lacinutrix sp. TaxID=574032 RepID=UPI0026323807|nr:hypothetical protein [uncultured Lacinutrix sp.]